MSEPTRVAGGHKATLNNPNTSEEAKEHSRQVLSEMEESGELDQSSKDDSKNTGNVIGGKKAAIHNASVPEETKDRLRAELEEDGVDTSQL